MPLERASVAIAARRSSSETASHEPPVRATASSACRPKYGSPTSMPSAIVSVLTAV
jgi:hypothetical protein